ncbi:MAG: Ni/Fe-hydrogenase, b-type cytochrome subunit [Acidobacteria bacterium]|uniref:Ni/Fe-hydrogenase, b-type cytochrome subunit n=1 Tax=Candidatus Polarisedimenticola svalbardensis TaxID=2886004 RepID=A0A8J6Y8T6_9BACT|nr:Ni/Fe-hydrogenase, b-type cytochrome subunit [Candidatus Polarisedimenticola svalbardensis]
MDHEQVGRYRRIYVWEWPVRMYHWINAIAVILLIGTGYMIGNPQNTFYAAEAYQMYFFGTIRFVHFVCAFIFFFNFLVRIYWGFVGNRFSRWTNFITFRKAQWKEMWDILRVDIAQADPRMHHKIGHNSLAALVYFLSFLMFAFQSITGFAMYAANTTAMLPRMFTFIKPIMGGDFGVRQWHHAGMWFFILFTIVHVYLVFYHDYVEGRGTTSSMIGGWKFERKDILE